MSKFTDTLKNFLRKASYTISILFLLVIIYYLFIAGFLPSPKEKELMRENENLSLQYEIMSQKVDLLEDVLKDLQQRDDNLYRVLFESEPIAASVRNSGIDGLNRYEELENSSNSKILVDMAKEIDTLAKQVYIQSKSYDQLIELAQNKTDMLLHIPAIMPVANKDLKSTASGYGTRIDPIYKVPKFHSGMDFSAATGTTIYATGDGVVESAKRTYSGYGNCVIIDHGYGYKTLYAHMQKYIVRAGQKVTRGTIIGYVGNTGKSTGPHLHYEVIRDKVNMNPINYYFNDLTPEEYERMVELSSVSQTLD